MKKKVTFMCTAFRDGFQSVYGARVLTPDFLPALAAARNAGISYFEAGGGARYQSLYFYCQEDAFDMMDQFRETAGPDANLQTLSRGVNVVGLDSQSSDVIKLHADLFAKHGMTTIRNFDALNDVENLIHSGKCITDAGLHHQVCVTMMELPPGCVGAHDADFYESTLRQILDADIPFDSVCFKDASGTAVPSTVHESIKRARKMLPEGTFIHFHTHETAGISVQANMAALEAGADAIDLSLAPCSGGTCQPDVLVMWHALRGSDYDLDVDVDKVRDAEEVFKECMAEYFLPPEAIAVEPMIPWSPMPGGALTANTQMLRDNGIMDRYPEMIKAMGEVVERGGFGTSVTPVSQFYFQQAFNNVMMGPWQRIADDYGRMVLGYFGKTPVPPDPEVVKLAADQLEMEPTDRPPLELNDADPKKGVAAATQRLSDEELPISDENIFIVAACGDKGIAYLKGDAEMGVRKIDPTAADPAVSSGGTYSVRVDGTSYDVSVEGGRVNVGGRVFDVAVSDGTGVAEAPTDTGSLVDVVAQMPGKVIRIAAEPGAWVEAGDPVIVIEAMKMEVPVPAPSAGEVAQVHVAVGEQIPSGASLASLKGS
ncbi:MAG TPA: biotin/lipoyl-containing protein [Candidatus Latescibacteria bacterium]|jgi:pyruvate carboxylase subunit B|nr:biotin attachment protein [Gemmatimonadota bacterium]MDP7362862.1 biotin/lipoyl-containing protein [Candidatus Latescibacterota bacterium]MDP7633936.1 biotin/lipoyl-containing protein [Candidatus Latescibacterota bacterium]HJN28469.1 biotin/lipoyl-containing protein [Candidatus Latescibacterota bacterium]